MNKLNSYERRLLQILVISSLVLLATYFYFRKSEEVHLSIVHQSETPNEN